MKTSWLLMLFWLITAPSFAANFCTPLPVDPEFPAGLDGRYEIVGKDPNTGSAYTGTLHVSYGENAFRLSRTVEGATVHGDAWVEQCGADKILWLHARYYTRPATEIGCAFGRDGDNYNRITCRTRQTTKNWLGLESWFQDQ